jgi:quercetin dioxygenase-like cupin family protein
MMRVRFRTVAMTAAAVAAALAVRTSASLRAQSPQRPVIVPVNQEPQHRPVFANDVVAVLDVRFPPGYTTLFHTHANDNVSVRIETGPLRIDTLAATGAPQTAAVGRVVFNSATPPYTHRITNLGDTAVRIVDIEVLAKAPTRVADRRDDLAGHEIVADNARVRLSRIVVPAGQSLAAHGHPRGWLTVVVRGAEPGSFQWHEAGASTPALTAGASALEIVEIDVK